MFYSIGHGKRPLEDFLELLSINHVSYLVDVRYYPRSRKNPQYNTDTLPDNLPIPYTHILSLGGRHSKGLDHSPNTYWTHKAFQNYADYTQSDAFQKGLEELLVLGKDHHVAYFCAETLWWKCHRRIITDYLILHKQSVQHILSKTNVSPAFICPAAIPQPNGSIHYPSKDILS